jgi:arylsulfatase A-like enzyme
MTGKYPARLHLTDYIPGGKDRGLRSPKWTKHLALEEVTVAELLGKRGYACGHFGKWHLNEDKDYQPGRPRDPGSQGFDDVLAVDKPRPDAPPESDTHHAREITDRAVAFMAKHKDQPFFCYVSHSLVHRPVIARPSLLRHYEQRRTGQNQKSAAYAAMVHELDESVGRIAATLDELQLAGRTLFIFASDNGGFLGDEKDQGTSNAPLRAGKGTNYEGGVRVPTIVRWPGVVKDATTCDEPIISNDLFPTLLQAAGADDGIPPESAADSLSFVSLLKDPTAHLDREALYWHYPHYHAFGATPHGAVRMGDWKLIEFFEDMHVELYNIKDDIGEQHDLAAAKPDVAEQLKSRLHQWREDVVAQMPTRP